MPPNVGWSKIQSPAKARATQPRVPAGIRSPRKVLEIKITKSGEVQFNITAIGKGNRAYVKNIHTILRNPAHPLRINRRLPTGQNCSLRTHITPPRRRKFTSALKKTISISGIVRERERTPAPMSENPTAERDIQNRATRGRSCGARRFAGGDTGGLFYSVLTLRTILN
jgi:hypothetical protein